MKVYASVEEILNDADIRSAYQRGQLIDEFRSLHPVQPPAPPLPTPAARIELSQICAALMATRDNLLTLNSAENQYRERLPDVQAALVDLERSTSPDAPEAALLKIAADKVRVQLLTDFVSNAAARRELLLRQLHGHFGRLNHLMEPLTGQKFFLNGSRPELNAADALRAIDALLK